jgi:hypothetical protein
MRNWRILAGAAACALALTATTAQAASSAAGVRAPSVRHHPDRARSASRCAAISNLYGTAKSLLRACGYTIYPLRTVIKNSDGSTTYVYNVQGHKVTSVVPPPGFDALKASNSQLQRYGLPTREALGDAQFRQLMTHLTVPAPHRYLIADPNAPRFTFHCRTCWAGYQADNHSDYYEAIASYHEPAVRTACPSPRLEGIWVGVGDERTTIGQAGTTDGTGHSHQSFWEVIGPHFPGPPMFGNKAKAGDKITTYVTYPSGEGAYTFTVMDKSKVILQNNFSTSVYQGKFALFVVEDPTLGSRNPYLPNFGKVTFTNARAVLVGHLLQKLGSFPHASFKITDLSRRTMASVGSLSSGNKFTVTYHRCN